MPFNIGPGELIVILIIALIVVGPGKLPDVGSALGKSIREFRKAATDVKESTSLDAAPPAPASQATPVASVSAAPVAASIAPPAPPAPVVAPPAPVAVEAAPVPVAVEDAAPAVGSWPAEVTPVDEQQPTASA